MKTSIIAYIPGAARRISAFPSLPACRSGISGVLILVLVWALVLPFSACNDRRRPNPQPVPSPSPSPTPSPAPNTETFIVYGPKRFTRNSGEAVTTVENFSIPANAIAPFTVLVENGGPNASDRVSSATIKLNGQTLYRSDDFNQNTSSLTKPVALKATHSRLLQQLVVLQTAGLNFRHCLIS